MPAMPSLIALTGIAGTSFVLALSGALMPGPLLTVTVAEAARRGTRAGPLIITGHALLELVLVLAVVKGLGPYLKASPVIGTIALVGGFLLLLLGTTMLRQASGMSLEPETAAATATAAPTGNPILLGIVGSLSNPYWILWWVTIGLGYLATAGRFGWAGISAFFLGHIAADYGWYILVAFGVSRGRKIGSDRGYRLLIRACGLFLIGFGGWFLYAAWGYLGQG